MELSPVEITPSSSFGIGVVQDPEHGSAKVPPVHVCPAFRFNVLVVLPVHSYVCLKIPYSFVPQVVFLVTIMWEVV